MLQVVPLNASRNLSTNQCAGVSNTAGAAIWLLDYTLQAASLNIKEVYYHHGIGFKYVSLTLISSAPKPSDPQIQLRAHR